MKMLRCTRCEELLGYNEPILTKIAWDYDLDAWDMVCPHCGGEIEEVTLCKVCEEWHSEDRMTDDDICMECVEKYATPENLLKYAEAENIKDEVEINSFAMSVLGILGISLNDIAVKVAKDLIEDCHNAVRLKDMAEDVAVKEFVLKEFIDKTINSEVYA